MLRERHGPSARRIPDPHVLHAEEDVPDVGGGARKGRPRGRREFAADLQVWRASELQAGRHPRVRFGDVRVGNQMQVCAPLLFFVRGKVSAVLSQWGGQAERTSHTSAAASFLDSQAGHRQVGAVPPARVVLERGVVPQEARARPQLAENAFLRTLRAQEVSSSSPVSLLNRVRVFQRPSVPSSLN